MRARLRSYGPRTWFLLALFATGIVVGLIVPDGTGTTIEACSWAALAISIILQVGIRSTPTDDTRGEDRHRL